MSSGGGPLPNAVQASSTCSTRCWWSGDGLLSVLDRVLACAGPPTMIRDAARADVRLRRRHRW
jgi:hypothetical protein